MACFQTVGVLISSAPLTRRGRVLLDAQPSTWQTTIRAAVIDYLYSLILILYLYLYENKGIWIKNRVEKKYICFVLWLHQC